MPSGQAVVDLIWYWQ